MFALTVQPRLIAPGPSPLRRALARAVRILLDRAARPALPGSPEVHALFARADGYEARQPSFAEDLRHAAQAELARQS